ncbi:glycosyltransferase family 61 protein [Rhodobacteraceae bacterium]|nr:glycosyltransferase family 61 protein [Paracoccaceae bacterium]
MDHGFIVMRNAQRKLQVYKISESVKIYLWDFLNMRFDYLRPPLDVFHMPAVHQGMSYIGAAPEWVLRPIKGGEIRLFAASESVELNERLNRQNAKQLEWLHSPVMEVNAVPVVLQNARFERGFCYLDGRIWLNGASGLRARTQFHQTNTDEWRRERLLTAFRRTRNNATRSIAPFEGDETQFDVAIELKNGFNYYHFTAETLGALAHFEMGGLSRPLRLHLPDGELKGFVHDFVTLLFPKIAPLVQYISRPVAYETVRSVYCHNHYLYAFNDASVDAVLGAQGCDPRWPATARNPANAFRANKNLVDHNLRLLRECALRHVRAREVDRRPKLVWMGRDEGGMARGRGMSGQEPLLHALEARGFVHVVLEKMTPLEQIEAMQAADIIIAPHGAGLVNMIYAKAGARVIEIGTRQTQLHRWGDFVKCAHIARCRYDTVFADIEGLDSPQHVPPMKQGHRGIHIGQNAMAQILSIVDGDLGAAAASAVQSGCA